MAMLSGQIAIVTGAGRGIGSTISKRLAVLGATVLLVGRSTNPLIEVKGEIEAAGARLNSIRLTCCAQKTSVLSLRLSTRSMADAIFW